MDNNPGTASSHAVPDNLLRHDFQVTDLAIDLALETASILNYGVRSINSTEMSNDDEQLMFSSLKKTTWDFENIYTNPSTASVASSSDKQQRSIYSDNKEEEEPFSKSVTDIASKLVHQVSNSFMKFIPMQVVPSFSTRTALDIPSTTTTTAAAASTATAMKMKTIGGLSCETSVSQQIDRSDTYLYPPALLADINYNYATMLANADGNYHWLDRPPLGNTSLLLFDSSSIYHLSSSIYDMPWGPLGHMTTDIPASSVSRNSALSRSILLVQASPTATDGSHLSGSASVVAATITRCYRRQLLLPPPPTTSSRILLRTPQPTHSEDGHPTVTHLPFILKGGQGH